MTANMLTLIKEQPVSFNVDMGYAENMIDNMPPPAMRHRNHFEGELMKEIFVTISITNHGSQPVDLIFYFIPAERIDGKYVAFESSEHFAFSGCPSCLVGRLEPGENAAHAFGMFFTEPGKYSFIYGAQNRLCKDALMENQFTMCHEPMTVEIK